MLCRLAHGSRAPQFAGGDFLPGFDPARGGFPFFIRAVHGEGRHYALLLEPPNAEAAALQVAALYGFVGPRSIAPELVRKVEHVGKEIRYMAERRAVAEQGARAMLALRNGVIPVLHTAPFPE